MPRMEAEHRLLTHYPTDKVNELADEILKAWQGLLGEVALRRILLVAPAARYDTAEPPEFRPAFLNFVNKFHRVRFAWRRLAELAEQFAECSDSDEKQLKDINDQESTMSDRLDVWLREAREYAVILCRIFFEWAAEHSTCKPLIPMHLETVMSDGWRSTWFMEVFEPRKSDRTYVPNPDDAVEDDSDMPLDSDTDVRNDLRELGVRIGSEDDSSDAMQVSPVVRPARPAVAPGAVIPLAPAAGESVPQPVASTSAVPPVAPAKPKVIAATPVSQRMRCGWSAFVR